MKNLLLLPFVFIFFAFATKAQTYFPPLVGNTWETTDPADLGWCEDSIQKMYNWLENSDSKAFIVLKNGKIVLEKYFGTFTADSFHVWNSAGKTLTAYAVGIAQYENLLNINDKSSDYLGAGWTNLTTPQEDAITIKHQLSMTKGLDDGLSEIYCTDASCLVYKAPAGTRWAYHNGPYTLLDSVLKVATGMPLNTWIQQKIGSKIGMQGLYVSVGYNKIFVSKPRSMARFGLLLSQNGYWNGTSVLPDPTYLSEMTNSSQSLNLSYGYLTWLNGKSSFMLPQTQYVFNGSLCPNAPADMYAAEGKNGQIINVVPSQNIVLIRMGASLGNNLVSTTYNDTIWQYMNRLECDLSTQQPEISTWEVAPNPFSNEISISNLSGIETINITDEWGRVVAFKQFGNRIVLSEPKKGVYFLTLSTQQYRKSYKLIH
ncbi:MAG: T9SS type A sorting domain-containing protein [Bacteroidia bacterium]|nr:MAG: T9SS type A sorting domain-containing protein [Bacteroidia bacterium]